MDIMSPVKNFNIEKEQKLLSFKLKTTDNNPINYDESNLNDIDYKSKIMLKENMLFSNFNEDQHSQNMNKN